MDAGGREKHGFSCRDAETQRNRCLVKSVRDGVERIILYPSDIECRIRCKLHVSHCLFTKKSFLCASASLRFKLLVFNIKHKKTGEAFAQPVFVK